MSTPIEELLSKLKKVRKTSDGWQACCPAHDDTNPSLSVRGVEDGKILIKCFAGCECENIVSALGLSMRDLMPEENKPVEISRQSWPLYTVDRTRRFKKIRVNYSDGTKKYFFEPKPGDYGLSPKDLNFYNAENIPGAVDELVICEGEKTTDAALKLGLIAVGVPVGAPSIPSRHVIESFFQKHKIKKVILYADNDAPGISMMLNFKRALENLNKEKKETV